MKVWIALFRGINVGGRNSLRMKDLVAGLTSMKFRHVQTYIQSGNVVFQSPRSSAARLSSDIASYVEHQHGFRPQVIVLDAEQFRRAMDANPFPDAVSGPKTLHLFFLGEPATSPHDSIWGIGLREGDPGCYSRDTWRGRNWLGEVLTSVREHLKQEGRER